MKSNGITNLGNVMNMIPGQDVGSNDQITQEFGFLLNQKTSQELKPELQMPQKDVQSVDEMLPQQTFEKELQESAPREIVKVENVNLDKEAERLQGDYQEFREEITKVLAESLNISEEELIEVLEMYGITFESLISGDGLTQLMMQQMGTDEMTELLFSDTFQVLTQKLDELVQEFVVTSELTPQEWELVLQKLEESQKVVANADTTEVVDMQEVSTVAEESLLQEVETQETVSVELEKIVQNQTDSEEMKVLSRQDNVVEDIKPDTEMLNHQDALVQSLTEEQSSENGNSDFLEENSQSQQMTFQQTTQTTNAVGEEVVQVVEQTFVDVEDIIHQISEFTKVTVEQMQSSIEMQLNPAHLGKIYLQVVSKDGVITAQLAAQNEAVKQAIENQIVLLKDNLNQQGLKVDAVEVTIASHEFEQNLQNSQGQQEQEHMQNQHETGTSRRNLTVENLEELAMSLSEEESLVARMMLENGNSMDMTA